MDDPQALLQKAIQGIAELERLAAGGPASPEATKAWARGHFRQRHTRGQRS